MLFPILILFLLFLCFLDGWFFFGNRYEEEVVGRTGYGNGDSDKCGAVMDIIIMVYENRYERGL